MTKFPYGNDLKKVAEWIGRRDCPSNTWHIQYLGGAASLDDCEFHFLLHGLDNLVAAHCILKGNGLGLPLGPKGLVSIPRTLTDLRDTLSGEAREDIEQSAMDGDLKQKIGPTFVDRVSNSQVWNSCFLLTEEKQFMTRMTQHPFSLDDLDGSYCSVEVVSGSFVLIQWDKLSFSFPGDKLDSLTPVEMGSASAGFSMPGHTVGKYSCSWEVRQWVNNFYNRCPFRKGGERNIFTNNRFLLYLPPYTGYLFWSYNDYLRHYPKENYPFWQGLFPQLNESLEHFMENDWAGSVGGWVGNVPASYIAEFGPS